MRIWSKSAATAFWSAPLTAAGLLLAPADAEPEVRRQPRPEGDGPGRPEGVAEQVRLARDGRQAAGVARHQVRGGLVGEAEHGARPSVDSLILS